MAARPVQDTVPIYPGDGGAAVLVDVLLGGQPVRMLLDTGATTCLITPTIANLIFGNPVFLLDGNPFTPPAVAADVEAEDPQQAFPPFRIAPLQLKQQLTPHQRIEHGFALFD
jgi:Aspartyl protease